MVRTSRGVVRIDKVRRRRKKRPAPARPRPAPIVGDCPACPRRDCRLYRCRHCKALVCFGCVFRKKCCGVIPPEHRR